jgi:uncharacterized protein (DUF1330 family)
VSHDTVVAITPTSTSSIPSYLETVGSLVARHGGRYLARTARHERLEGEGEVPACTTIVEWPSRDAANAFYSFDSNRALQSGAFLGRSGW